MKTPFFDLKARKEQMDANGVKAFRVKQIEHAISSDSAHSNNRHEMARINHRITRELLIKMDEKMRRVVI